MLEVTDRRRRVELAANPAVNTAYCGPCETPSDLLQTHHQPNLILATSVSDILITTDLTDVGQISKNEEFNVKNLSGNML